MLCVPGDSINTWGLYVCGKNAKRVEVKIEWIKGLDRIQNIHCPQIIANVINWKIELTTVQAISSLPLQLYSTSSLELLQHEVTG